MIEKGENQPGMTPAHTIYIGTLPASPMGRLWLAASENGLVAIEWELPQDVFIARLKKNFHAEVIFDELRLEAARQQLGEYFEGQRTEFTIALDLSRLHSFQVQVLRLTLEIPYGQTSTYKALAARMNQPHAARAVGRAEATNPIPLVIPCHRVLGSDGSLHGYGGPGGVKMKAWLLELEQGQAVNPPKW